MLGACSGPPDDVSTPGSGVHAPAVPVSALDAGAEASLGDAAKPDVLDGAAIDSTDDAADGVDSADAGGCPSSTCSDDNLVHWGNPWGQCCAVKTPCAFGCASNGDGAACLPPDPAGPCAPGAPEADAAACPYAAKTLCFDTLEAACQCMGCSAGTCTPYKKGPRLKIPYCGFKKPTPDAGSGDAADAQPPSVDATADAADADAPVEASASDGDAMVDAAVVSKMGVMCK